MNFWPWMRRCGKALPVLVLLWLAGAPWASALTSEWSERLKQPDHVLLMRHAYATRPWGIPPSTAWTRSKR